MPRLVVTRRMVLPLPRAEHFPQLASPSRRIPKGFRLKAQGCEQRATLGKGAKRHQREAGAGSGAASAAPERAGAQIAGGAGRVCAVRRARFVPGGGAAGSGAAERRAMKRTYLDSSVLIQAVQGVDGDKTVALLEDPER